LSHVDEEDLVKVLRWVREMRRWALYEKIDPWAFRQALLIALEFDTEAALERGVTKNHLKKFDMLAKWEAKKILATFERG